MSTEVRATATTGGQKGRKAEEFALLPTRSLEEVARVYGFGATKYEPNNWRRGYPWSWTFSALMRHCWAFWRGESHDPESGLHHLAHACFHLFTLMEFQRARLGADDRGDSTRCDGCHIGRQYHTGHDCGAEAPCRACREAAEERH